MGEVNATIFVEKRGLEKGYGYRQWTIDFGKGKESVAENVTILCAESSQRYMSEEEAVNEAKNRIKVKIERECGNIPDEKIKWRVEKSD
ncbi:MAG: hypothetical protein ACREIH_01845 [Nitrospiraceae bacterium]